MSKISVIVPIYNVEKYLDKCVSSIVGQTYSDIEIILVDDGSPDGCPAMCDEWEKRDSRIRVIHKENGGLSSARNAGLDVAGGEYISFVDSDDYISESMLEALLGAIEKAGADICSCGIVNVYEDGREEAWNIKDMIGDSELFLRGLYNDSAVPVAAWNKLYKRELWSKMRFPEGRLCEDAFTTCFLLDKAKLAVQISDGLYYYRIRSGSIMTSGFRPQKTDEEEAWRCNVEFIEKRYPSLRKDAFNFYIQRVAVLLKTFTEEDKVRYLEEFGYLRSILKKNLSYITFGCGMPVKRRVKLIVDYIKL